jgi:GR25 family glycosyltransferase involved in LPS biosynthesis
MEAQLASAPQAVYRQKALGESECDLHDDVPTLYGQRNHTSEKSLFCSNYRVWKRALASHADFIVILEDDTILQPGFWDSVSHFAMSCGFDYTSVDSWKGDGNVDPDKVAECSNKGVHALYRPNPSKYLDYWGTHVQIIRRSYLQTMLVRAKDHGMGPMDVWWMMRINDGRSFSWQPGIARQAQHQLNTISTRVNRTACPGSIAKSDIEPIFMQEQAIPRFRCD